MPETEPRSDFGRFVSEMKRRHVVRFSVAYAAAAFVLLQLAEIVFPAFGIGEGGLRLLVAGVTLGFLPAVVLAWIYDITKEGIRRTGDGPGSSTPYRLTLLMFALTTIGLTGTVGWYLFSQGVFEDEIPASAALGYDPSQPIQSLVVLPLQDYSPGGDQGYLASGMHDEIIAQLSTIEEVRVVSRTTSMRYESTTLTVPEIGAELGVDVVIEGSVNRSGNQVRITLQVIHAASDSGIETLQIDGSADDLLRLQEDAAQRVATVIGSTYGRGELGRTAQGIPLAAQDAYYRARYEIERETPDAYQRAFDLSEEAVDLAPGFAEAWSALAAARFRRAFRLLSDDPAARARQYAQAEQEARNAVELDSTSIEVRDVYDNIRAARALVASRARQGPDGTGELVAGRPAEDSIAIGVQAVEAMWLSTMTTLGQQIRETVRDSSMEGSEAAGQLTFEARIAMAAGDFTQALELLDSIVVAFPQTQEAWDQLLRAHVALGHLDEAVTVVERWNAAAAPGAPGAASLARLRTAIERGDTPGYWTWRRNYLVGQQEAGEDIVLTDLAAAFAASGQRQRAYGLLRQALDAGESRLYAVPNDPVWDPLRADPRFRAIEQEIQRRQVDLSLQLSSNDAASNG